MKIYAGPEVPKLHHVNPASRARASFPDLIAAPDRAKAETADQAVGFQALGVFGVCNATPYQPTAVPLAIGSGTPPDPAPLPDPLVPARSLPADPAHHMLRGLPMAKSPLTALPPLSPSSPTSRDGSGGAGAPSIEAGGDPSEDPAVRTAGEGRPSRHKPQSQSAGASLAGVRVVKSTTDNAAVVATLPGISADEAERFRARAEAVLREFGLVLDKVAINGDDRPEVDPWGRGSHSWR